MDNEPKIDFREDACESQQVKEMLISIYERCARITGINQSMLDQIRTVIEDEASSLDVYTWEVAMGDDL